LKYLIDIFQTGNAAVIIYADKQGSAITIGKRHNFPGNTFRIVNAAFELTVLGFALGNLDMKYC